MITTANYWMWLRGIVGGLAPELNPFFTILYTQPYRPPTLDDLNRAADGKNLRERYLSQYGTARSSDIPIDDCTFLEFLIGLANRLNESTYDPNDKNKIAHWFWFLVENLGLDQCVAAAQYSSFQIDIMNIIERYLDQDYAPDGSEGGLFPLRKAPGDVRVMSVWDQMQLYLMEYFE